MPYVGILQAAGLAKESQLGTLATPPTEYLPLIAPDSFSESIDLLESKGIRQQADAVIKVAQGAATLKGGKIKLECEPENCGNILMGAFGTDTLTETATFVIGNTNKYIDFKEDGGAERSATIATGTYAMGTTSATAATLCKAIKDAMEAATGATGTYTVTYSYSTRKLTIAAGGAVTDVQILWLTGTNQANGAYAVLGFSHADTSNATSVTSDSTTAIAAHLHTFTRAATAQLPTYSWWFKKGAKYFQFAGCMLNKLDIDVKAKEFVTMDADYVALKYDDTGTSKSPTYSALKPFTFSQAVVSIDSSPVTDYDSLQISIDNMVEAEHTLTNSIYPTKIYSKGMKVTLSLSMFLENTTQWAKFLAGTSAHVAVTLTSGEALPGSSSYYSLTIDVPVVNYTAAPLMIDPGVLKVAFSGTAVYDVSSTKTISVALTNTAATAY